MKKWLSLIAVSTLATVVGTTTGVSALENVATQVNKFNDSSILKTGIGDVLVNKNLGTINTKGLDQPTDQQIKNAIKKANSGIEINAVVISDITNTTAKVTGINIYEGTTNVTFKVNKKVSITDVLKNTNLGEIDNNNVTPSQQQVKEAILANNPTLKIDAIIISDITNSSAQVTGDNVLYTGSVVVVYTVV